MLDSSRTYCILGAARSGLAVAKLLRRAGASVFLSDHQPEGSCVDAASSLRSIGADFEFGGHTERVLESDVLVLSPGVPDTIPIVRSAVEKGIELASEIEIASRVCPAPIVAITGTNGKTTTTELTGAIFRLSGRKTFVAGNVGLAFSQIVDQCDSDSVVVLEVSSFQLEHISSFRPRVAVLLNATPDHLDRYQSFDHYLEAKLRIAKNLGAGDAIVFNADSEPLVRKLHGERGARVMEFSLEHPVAAGAYLRDSRVAIVSGSDQVDLIDAGDIRIRGPHNLANAMAASLATFALGVPATIIAQGLREFPGVAHRLEPVRELDGVSYVNDSKATNVDSVRYALSSFGDRPLVLIAGGRGKKNNYDSILGLVREHVRTVILIGEAAGEMEEAFAPLAEIRDAGNSMADAVAIAHSIADSGDVVLLSPACASFDMFDNYEQRGDVFKKLVHQLPLRSEPRDGAPLLREVEPHQ